MRVLRFAAAAAASAFVLTACFGPMTPTADVGDCLQVSDLGSEIDDLPTVSCDEPHEAEVYHVSDIDSDGSFDFDTVVEIATDVCLEEFETFVGIEYFQSELDIFYLHPIADGWEAGDREILCAVTSPNWETGGAELNMVTGTLEGANR